MQLDFESAPASSKQPLQVLKETFGYDSFRPLQERIIDHLLKKQDCLVVMPTGGGKSLCYQVPALVFSGITVVVSPLISLMQDQVEQLQAAGVRATLVNSSLEIDDYEQRLLELRQGDYDLVYMAPETLLKPRITGMLSSLPVDCLAIDEAHCVSEWGHDFRPEYRQIASLREKLPGAVFIALTATATSRVQGDIIKSLKLRQAERFIASFDRPNLFLQVRPRERGIQQIVDFVKTQKGQPGIIYCFSRKRTEQVQQKLEKENIVARVYHAGLSREEREVNQQLFSRDKVQVIVATIAFGMGINKSNVRFVVHADLPKNIEGYYQEIGRAGRDGVESHCVLYYGASDAAKINHFISQKSEKEKKLASGQLQVMMQYCESHHCRRHFLLGYFSDQAEKDTCQMCDNCTEEKNLADLSEEAQKLLSCVHRLQQRFGLSYVIDVLRGSKNQRILENSHDNLSTYNIGQDLTKNQWQSLARQLIAAGFIRQDVENYNVIVITDKGYLLLKSQLLFKGTLEKPRQEKGEKREIARDYDDALFEKLRQKRTELAEASALPPYMVFSDKTLIDMSHLKPVNQEQFLLVHGVGAAKLEKYGNDFLEVVRHYCES